MACNSVLDFSGAAMFVASREREREREREKIDGKPVLVANCQTCLSATKGITPDALLGANGVKLSTFSSANPSSFRERSLRQTSDRQLQADLRSIAVTLQERPVLLCSPAAMCSSESQEPPTRALFADFDALQVDELQALQRKTRVARLTDVEPFNENSLNLKRMMAMTPELVLECPEDLTHPDERALGENRDKWSGKVG